MKFVNPLILWSALAAVIPLLIYLLTRDRITTVPFSTLRFFAGNSATLVKRKKWLEILLLALRAALIAIIVFAFARPFFAKKTDASGKTKVSDAVVVAVDVSQSMTSAWSQAVERAKKAIDDLPSGAAVTLIAFDQSARVESNWADASQANTKLASLQPTASGTDLSAALKKSDELLTQINADTRQVIVISDLQKVATQSLSTGWKLAPGIKLKVEQIASDKPANLAIVAANIPQTVINDHQPHPITVRLSNFAKDLVKDASLELTGATKDPLTQKLSIPTSQPVTASFRPVFNEAGDHPATLTLKNPDGATASTLFLNTHVMPRISIAILVRDEELTKPGAATFFLSRAIRPSDDSPFEVKLLSAANASAADLEKVAVVIINDVTQFGVNVQTALNTYRQRGGGLLLLPGDRTQPEAFTAAFGESSPAKLRRIMSAVESRKGSSKALITRVDLQHPIFEVFQRPHSGNFSAVQIDRYWEVADSQLAKVPVRLDDGRPFLLEKQNPAGGSTVLMVSPPDPSWNNFIQRATFLPMLHQTLRYLAVRSEKPTQYFIGDVLPIGPKLKLKDPAGQFHTGDSFIAQVSGHYSLIDSSDKTVFVYAVNTPFNESDATTIPATELIAAVESADQPGDNTGTGTASFNGPRRELWMIIVALSLALVVVELFVSNKVERN